MKNSILFLCSLMLLFTSCNKDETLIVSETDIEFLRSYVDQSESYASIVGEFDINANTLFDVVVFSNGCDGGGEGYTVQAEAQGLMIELLEKMNFDTPRDVHNWVVKAGKIMYDIKVDNPDLFKNDVEFANELACMIVPEIETRDANNSCYKENLIQFFRDTHRLGGMYGIRFNKEEEQRQVTAVICQQRGSAFHRLWSHMSRTYECK